MTSKDSDATKAKADLHDQRAIISVKDHAAGLKAGAHTLTPREKLSVYFTIAAAAFGLISDGCKANAILSSS